jgi:hypothetical protein
MYVTVRHAETESLCRYRRRFGSYNRLSDRHGQDSDAKSTFYSCWTVDVYEQS